MKMNNNTNSHNSKSIIRNQSDPAPLYRQEHSDLWDGILHTLLELCMPVALLLCGWTLSGSITGSKPANATAPAAAQIAAVSAPVVSARGFQVAAR